MSRGPFVMASNRAPVSFELDAAGELIGRRGAGGLISGIGPLVRGTDTTWIAAAMTDGDRIAASRGTVEAEGFRVRQLDIDEADYRAAYDVVCNSAIWFIHHGLYDLPHQPRFDRHFWSAWDAYRRVNVAFAEAIDEASPEGATVLVQDYHLALVGSVLAKRRPDLRAVHFSHTPFARPDELRILPDDLAAELLDGMSHHHACGFHAPRWAQAFEECCDAVLGRRPPTFVSPLATDPDDIRGVAASADCDRQLSRLESLVGDRQVIGRSDRVELSKNLLRGFEAYELLLDEHPEWHDRVVFAASVYPSRVSLPAYLAYGQEVETRVRHINQRFGTATWTPVLLDMSDDHARSVALLRRTDVLLVNPVRDGLNLVAPEGALVNERDGVLLLSPDAGIFDQLGDLAIRVHPYDIAGTADALDTALRLEPAERADRAARLRARAESRTAADWLDDQLAAARA